MDSSPVKSDGSELQSADEHHPADHQSDGEPSGYEAVWVESEPPPLSYDAVMAEEVTQAQQPTPLPKGSLIAEAPPSYRDIFGGTAKPGTENKQSSGRERGPHTHPRSSRGQGNIQSTDHTVRSVRHTHSRFLGNSPKVATMMVVIGIALTILALPLAMVFVGALNLGVCSSKDVPLYLVIGGCCLCIEILIHMLTVLASLNTDNESTNRSLRMCDCFAFFILIWILIGSNWIFKISVNSRSCSEMEMDYELLGEISNETAVTTPSPCQDCSDAVYQFAISVIVIQYIVVFATFVFCCCAAIKKASK